MRRWLAVVSSCALWCGACGGGDDDGGGTPDGGGEPTPDASLGRCAEAEPWTPVEPESFYNDMFTEMVVPYTTENPYSHDKAILGKILFWEEQMSSDDTVACGTCHRSASGGSDPRAADGPGFPSSLGAIHGAQGIRACTDDDGDITYGGDQVQVTKRKPPSYLDAMFGPDLFWDGRATGAFTDPDAPDDGPVIAAGAALESQVTGPPLSDVEMACADRTWPLIHAKLESAVPLALATDLPPDMLAAVCEHPSYPELFEAAFGDPAITTQRIAFAIATHERTLLSNQTPYDRFRNGEEDALTADQQAGLVLMSGTGKCQRCHPEPLFSNGTFVNLGLINYDDPDGDPETDDIHVDLGREEFTDDIANRGQFRVATIRNVGLREAQGVLHDGIGSGSDLSELMAAYNDPPKLDAHTDPRMDPATVGNVLGLTGEEIGQMLDFMRNGLTDPRVEDETYPFDKPKLSTE